MPQLIQQLDNLPIPDIPMFQLVDQKKGRPRKSSTREDLLLVEALKCGKTVERNERQTKNLEYLQAGLY